MLIRTSCRRLVIKRKYDEPQEQMIDHFKLYDTLRTRQPEEFEGIPHQAGGDVKRVMEDIQEGSLLLELTSSPHLHLNNCLLRAFHLISLCLIGL